jgi:branched-subunit amino acid ABC-type transport system permease component
VLLHINTGLFWIYGFLVTWLSFLVAEFAVKSATNRLLLALPIGLLAAFWMPQLVYRTLWRWFRNRWVDSYAMGTLLLAILLIRYFLEVRDRNEDAVTHLITGAGIAFVVGLWAYSQNRSNRGEE